ncbi:hypothetical protein CDAR_246861 [Caerostris darwini]|uniref:Uncharacterized protein n=1 Tax=Caerostris darwini TaxID=1538125 RepID=A0AAV4W8F1_9ARAC|nr:hypothetical protein CDAR_246861 [Caerostris darwini]
MYHITATLRQRFNRCLSVRKQTIPEQSASNKKRRERDRQSKDILCRQCNWLAPRHHKTLPFIKSPAKVNNLGSFRSTSVWKKHIIYVLTLGSKVRSKSFGGLGGN